MADREALNGIALPALTGSPSQVAWAEGIRLRQLDGASSRRARSLSARCDTVEAHW